SRNTRIMRSFILILPRFPTSVEDEYPIDIIHIALQLDVGILAQSVFITLGLHSRADDESFREIADQPAREHLVPFFKAALVLDILNDKQIALIVIPADIYIHWFIIMHNLH